MGPDFMVQLSFTGMKCQAAPSSIQMQPVCVLNSRTSSHLGAFTHAVPSAWKASLSSSRFEGHFLPEASPEQILPVVTGLVWMADAVCLGTAGRIPGSR